MLRMLAHLGADYDMVATRVHCKCCDQASSHHQLLGKRLLGKVVHAHVGLCCDKEEGLAGVEGHAHHAPLVLAEGVLSQLAGQLMHQDGLQSVSNISAE